MQISNIGLHTVRLVSGRGGRRGSGCRVCAVRRLIASRQWPLRSVKGDARRLIVYSVDDAPGLAIARARGFPVVSVDQQPEPGVAAVNITDRDGAAAAVAHLAGLGHTALAAVAVAAGPSYCGFVDASATSRNHVVRERLAGWRSACLAAGVHHW